MQICRKTKYIDGGGVDLSNTKKRVGWIDIAKGIAILLVVYGHTINYNIAEGKLPGGLIYSFHMPLFFILSAITSRYSIDLKSFKQNSLKTIKNLLIPAIAIYFIFIVYHIYNKPDNFFSWQFWKEAIFTFIFYHCSSVRFEGINVPSMRTSWFLIALMVAKILFDYLQMKISKKILVPFVIFGSIIGISLGKHEVFVFSFDIAFAVLPFLYIGYRFKDIENIKFSTRKKIIVNILLFTIWIGLSLLSYKNCFNLAVRRYPLYPLCFIAAIAGSLVFIEVSKILEKLKIFVPLQYLGKYCIYFYCVHCIDFIWKSWYTITNNVMLNFLTRVAIDLAFFLLLVGLHISITQIIKHRKFKKESKV